MSISFNPEMCPSILSRNPICQVTNSTHLWRYTTFLKECSTEFFLIQVASKTHITQVLYARNPQHPKHLASLSQQLHSIAAWELVPRVPPIRKAFWKRFILKWSILTYPIPFFFSWCSKCLSEPGECIAATLRAHCGRFLFTCEETRAFYIYFLKWSHIKELRKKKAIQPWWLMYNVYRSVKTKY